MAAAGGLREARTLREDELLELTHTLRKELERRGERLPPGWTDEAIGDLRSGRLTGWARPPAADGGELGFYSRRGRRAFGHVHLIGEQRPVDRAVALLRRLGDDPGLQGLALTAGVTGVPVTMEGPLGLAWADRADRTAVRREGLELAIEDPALWSSDAVPAGHRLYPIAAITEAALADLDWRGFQGSLDAKLFGSDPTENARMVADILGGGLGRLIPEASTGLLDGQDRLAGLLLTIELSPRVGLFADLVVDPAARRRGLGRFLLRWGFRSLRALGYSTARLWVTEGNLPARGLYESMGFRRYASTTVYLQDGAAPQPHDAR